MNYKQIEEYVLNIPKFRAEGSIEQTRKFYEFLGKPGNSALMIHVAGTNGKGSTCAYMNSVLTEAGYKVGMFTSPHLVSVRERIRVNNELVSEQKFEKIFDDLTVWIEKYNRKYKDNLRERIEDNKCEVEDKITVNKQMKAINQNEYLPTFYEFLFFMAMLYFEEQQVDIIILETGLGGRLDATNVIDAPKVAVITEIGKDHMEYLGDTYELIAAEKAGIIKVGSSVVYSGKRQEVSEVIERKSAELGVLCKCVEKLENQNYRFVDKEIDFSFYSRYYGCIPIKLNTYAIYQVENALVALTAIEELEMKVSKEAMQTGMQQCKWEGRMEEILPGVFLDGAHNEDGIDAFVASVKEDGCRGCRWLLFSAVADKEYCIMKENLLGSGLFDIIYAAPLKTARGIAKKELENIFADSRSSREKAKISDSTIDNDTEKNKLENTVTDYKIRILDSTSQGFREILSLKKEEDFVYIVGSLYLVGEIKELNLDTQR